MKHGHITPAHAQVPPLPSLNPGPALEEGQGLTLAASCTAEGSPAPSVTWDTEVKGTATSRSFKHSRSAAVTSEFHLVPSRSMNGQPLTCVVSHPGLLQDQRITHILQVAFLTEASVRGLEDQKLWQVGREGATLKCLSEGYPSPSYNWTRLDGPLPSGVRAEGDTLGFPPLTPEHSGIYVCHVSNELSSRDSQVTVDILGHLGDGTVTVDPSLREGLVHELGHNRPYACVAVLCVPPRKSKIPTAEQQAHASQDEEPSKTAEPFQDLSHSPALS
ncbi:nectin-4 [Puma concolor]|uniref:Nectin-4 n=1 Tax=Puma concolor TaxID=9696 RepID=A0A6P6H5D8_PUMCO|nr:nectin-4 [Puma concolor]